LAYVMALPKSLIAYIGEHRRRLRTQTPEEPPPEGLAKMAFTL